MSFDQVMISNLRVFPNSEELFFEKVVTKFGPAKYIRFCKDFMKSEVCFAFIRLWKRPEENDVEYALKVKEVVNHFNRRDYMGRRLEAGFSSAKKDDIWIEWPNGVLQYHDTFCKSTIVRREMIYAEILEAKRINDEEKAKIPDEMTRFFVKTSSIQETQKTASRPQIGAYETVRKMLETPTPPSTYSNVSIKLFERMKEATKCPICASTEHQRFSCNFERTRKNMLKCIRKGFEERRRERIQQNLHIPDCQVLSYEWSRGQRAEQGELDLNELQIF